MMLLLGAETMPVLAAGLISQLPGLVGLLRCNRDVEGLVSCDRWPSARTRRVNGCIRRCASETQK